MDGAISAKFLIICFALVANQSVNGENSGWKAWALVGYDTVPVRTVFTSVPGTGAL
jgi:hypothetical protein